MLGVTTSSFFFNDTATTEIYTLSLHDALPILAELGEDGDDPRVDPPRLHIRHPCRVEHHVLVLDRKSTRLNSSHANISYAVFCLKKKHKIKLLPHLTINFPIVSLV